MTAIRTVLAAMTPHIQLLCYPVHSHFPFGVLDIFGAIRLSQIIDWIARGVFDAPTAMPSDGVDRNRQKHRTVPIKRAAILQECLGLLLVLFGGETFLGELGQSVLAIVIERWYTPAVPPVIADISAICSRSTPSWVVSPKIGLLFVLTREFRPKLALLSLRQVDMIQTRTPLRRFIPHGPSLALELLLAIPDAIGRTLLLTRFTVLPLLHPKSGIPTLPPTPTTLILIPFIIASPFAALAFSGLNLFSADPTLSIPLELRPKGWMMVDAWLPLAIPALFCSLIGPVEGWTFGLGCDEDEAVIVCLVVVLVSFIGRAVYNFGHESERWRSIVGKPTGRRKFKTA